MRYANDVETLSRLLKAFVEKRSDAVEKTAAAVVGALKAGRKILLFGNGGSAAEAQHFAAEMVNKFITVRRGLPAIALTTDASCLTSIANDTSFDNIFSRQIEALGSEGDVAVALTTSGTSPNVIEGLKTAKSKGLVTVALTGEGGGKIAGLADYLLDLPSKLTPRLQEAHLFLLHVLAEEIDARL